MFAAKNFFSFKKGGGTNALPISYVLVGGGGNGGNNPTDGTGGGGGGGGAVLTNTFSPIIGTVYNIAVASNGYQSPRQITSAFNIIAGTGGNGGRVGLIYGPVGFNGENNSSGGGSSHYANADVQGSAGNGAGFPGGAGIYSTQPTGGGGGGGGGAGGAGGTATSFANSFAGSGGIGKTVSVAGVSMTFGGGGGGATPNGISLRGVGGSSIGGNGGYVSGIPQNGTDGVIDTGSGGGGGYNNGGYGRGSNGIVIIWYSGSLRASVSGATTTTVGSFIRHTFTSGGTISFTS